MLACLLLASAVIAQVEPAAPRDRAAEVATLVTQLDSSRKAERDAAEQSLIALGHEILDLLPELGARVSAETAQRLHRVRARLERERGERSIAASRVTLDLSDIEVAEALATLSRRSSNALVDFRAKFGQGADERKVSIHVKDEPFWRVLDSILDQADLDLYPFAGADGLAWVTRSPARSPRLDGAAYAGCFRVEPLAIVAQRGLRDTSGDMLQIKIETAWEPRVRPIMLLQPGDQISAIDDQGRPLRAAEASNRLEIIVTPKMLSVEMPLRFDLPPRDARSVARLEGTFDALLSGRVETFAFGDLENDQRQEIKKASVKVVLEGVRKNRDVWQARLGVVLDEANSALDSHRRWIYNNPCHLEGPDGTITPNAGYEAYRQTPTELGVAYMFAIDSLAGQKLVYQTPAMILSLPIHFELSDLELP